VSGVPVDRQRALLATVRRMAAQLASPFDQVELLREVSESCTRILDADDAGVSILDGDRLRFVSATSERSELIELFQSRHDEGPCHEALRTGEHVPVPDIAADGRWPSWSDQAVALGFEAADAFPLRLGGEIVGVLDVYGRRARALDAWDVDAGCTLADLAAAALVTDQALADHRRVQEQLQHALDSRVVIEQAKGVLAERHGIGVEVAFERIRRRARSSNRRVADLAGDVVAGRVDLPDDA